MTLPRHLADKGFEMFAPGIARRAATNPARAASRRWEWIARIPSGWTTASSEKNARHLAKKTTETA